MDILCAYIHMPDTLLTGHGLACGRTVEPRYDAGHTYYGEEFFPVHRSGDGHISRILPWLYSIRMSWISHRRSRGEGDLYGVQSMDILRTEQVSFESERALVIS